ncbi:hypothetical protein DJ481_17990 [Enterobacter hormaechei]|uniref:hypothetical protein n=1 Tax=Enterobacter hormaechei TaxID=158836 RepID=UPI0011E441A4|nr:hypothetical protein [Enterobacter hormaechei]EKK4044088.1 hypothetical protein [Cronobacter sakazakii]TYF16364.1 hypothetical protein DJ481_17990 [Enterobacter hormaechei]
MAMKATINTLTRENVIAWGYQYDESARFCITRQTGTGRRRAVGVNESGSPRTLTPAGMRKIRDLVWVLHNDEIPPGYTVVNIADSADCSLSNLELVTVEEAAERRKARRIESAKQQRCTTKFPRGIVESRPGYYVASFVRQGKRTHKTGRDLDGLILWLLRERDGLDLTMGGKL